MRKTLENSAQKLINALSDFLPLFIKKTEDISQTAKKTVISFAKKAGYWSLVGVVGIMLAGTVMQVSGVPVLPEVAMAEQGFGFWVAVTIGNLLLWGGLGAGIVCALLLFILQVVVVYPYGEFFQIDGQQVGGYVTISAVVELWTILRDLSFAVIALAAAVGIFAVILNIGNYKWNQIMGRLVVVSLLINFSRTFVGLATDMGTVVMATFGNSFAGYFAVGLISGFGLPTLGDFAGDFVADGIGLSGVGTVVDNGAVNALVESSSWTQIIGAYLMLDIMYVVFIGMAITGIVVLLVAIVGKMLCAATVPLAMTATILPATQKFWTSWLGLFQKVMVAPIILVVGLWLTMIMLFGTGSSVVDDNGDATSAIGSQSLGQTQYQVDAQEGTGAFTVFNAVDIDQERAAGGQINKPENQFNSLQPNVLMQYIIAVILLGMTFKATASVRNLAPSQLNGFISNFEKTANNLSRFPARSFKSLASGLGTAPKDDGSFFGGYDPSQGKLKGVLGYAFNRKPVKVLSTALGLSADAKRTLSVGASQISQAFNDKDRRYDEKVVSLLQSEASLNLVHADDATGFVTGRDIGGQFSGGNFLRRFLSRSMMIGTSAGHKVAEDFLGPREALDAGVNFAFGAVGPSLFSQLGRNDEWSAGRRAAVARREIERLAKLNETESTGKLTSDQVKNAQREHDALGAQLSDMEKDMQNPDMDKKRDGQSLDMQAIFDIQLDELDKAYKQSRSEIASSEQAVDSASQRLSAANAANNAVLANAQSTDAQKAAAQRELESAKVDLEAAQLASQRKQANAQRIGDDISALNELRKQNSVSLNDIAAHDGGDPSIAIGLGTDWADRLNQAGGSYEQLENQQQAIEDQMKTNGVLMVNGQFDRNSQSVLTPAQEQAIKDRKKQIQDLKKKERTATKEIEDMQRTSVAEDSLITRAQKALREKAHDKDVTVLLNELNDAKNRNDIDGMAEYALAALDASNLETLQRFAGTELGVDLSTQRSGAQGMQLIRKMLSQGGMTDPDLAQLMQAMVQRKETSLLNKNSMIHVPGTQVPRFVNDSEMRSLIGASMKGKTETRLLKDTQGGLHAMAVNLGTGLPEIVPESYDFLRQVGAAVARGDNLNGERINPLMYVGLADAGADSMRNEKIPEAVIQHVMSRAASVDRDAIERARAFNEGVTTYEINVA